MGLLKEFYGQVRPARLLLRRRPRRLRPARRFLAGRQTLLDGGRGHAVIQQRMEFQEVMRDRFLVSSKMPRPHGDRVHERQPAHPDLMCEVFILAPTDLLDDHELESHGLLLPGPGQSKAVQPS